MNNRAIGVFDSGLGGLTAVKELLSCLPGEQIIYFGDTGRVPYGTRSHETVRQYVLQDIRFLKQFDIKMILLACGTASAIALEDARRENDLPILGVVQAAAEAAVQKTQNGKIGVLGTAATVHSGAYEKEIKRLMPEAEVFSTACGLFVPLVENGYMEHEATRLIAADYLAEQKAAGVDTLILGCTHYPLLAKVIGEIMGPEVHLINSGAEAAHSVANYLAENGLLAENRPAPTPQFYVSDSAEQFSQLGSLFLSQPLEAKAEKIMIETY